MRPPDEFHFGGVPDGWRDLVAAAVRGMREIDPEIDIVDIREEFGRLWHLWFSNVEHYVWLRIESIARSAEDASEKTCSVCGAPGVMRMPRELPFCDPCWSNQP